MPASTTRLNARGQGRPRRGSGSQRGRARWCPAAAASRPSAPTCSARCGGGSRRPRETRPGRPCAAGARSPARRGRSRSRGRGRRPSGGRGRCRSAGSIVSATVDNASRSRGHPVAGRKQDFGVEARSSGDRLGGLGDLREQHLFLERHARNGVADPEPAEVEHGQHAADDEARRRRAGGATRAARSCRWS